MFHGIVTFMEVLPYGNFHISPKKLERVRGTNQCPSGSELAVFSKDELTGFMKDFYTGNKLKYI